MSLDDTTGCCMLCEQHSREAREARAVVLALKAELLALCTEKREAMLYEAADELERLRASEAALKAEVRALKQELLKALDDWLDSISKYDVPGMSVEWNERIQQLESELGSGS